jgi:hypothetical protein
MTFLTTPYLWLGLAAAAVPVIIHLIRRTKVQVVHFAAMRFLQATPERMIRRQKLKQILLLLLRIVALLLLGLAFARPFLPGSAPIAILSKQQKSIAIVIDASASMLAGAKSEKAKEAAGQIIARGRGGDRFSIITAGATPQILLDDGDAAQARTAVAAVQPALAPGDLREAVLAADNLLRQQAARRAAKSELHVVSDFQLANSPEGMVTLNSNAESFAGDKISSWQNVAILDGTIDGLPACRVKNFANVEQMIEVALGSGRNTFGKQRVVLHAGEEKVVRFAESRDNLKNPGGAFFEVRAGIDDFIQDNQFFCSSTTASSSGRRVLAISSNSVPVYFVQQALAAAGGGLAFRVMEISADQLAGQSLAAYECIVLFSGSGLARNGVAALKKFVQEGGGLLIAPSPASGSSQQATTINLMLADLMPASLQQPVFPTVDRNRSSRLTDVDYAHPIFKLFANPASGDPASPRFFQYFAIDAKSRGGVALASFDDGRPALLEKTFGKGKVLLWTAGLDAQWSDLPLRPIFLPMIHQMVGYLARPHIKKEPLAIGQPILLDGFDASQDVKVVLPEGTEREIAAGSTSFNETAQAGVYSFYQRGGSESVAVNLDRRESDPRALSAADFLARLNRSAEQAHVAGIFGSAETSELEHERSQKLWRVALLILLVVLIAEGWLAKRTPR